MKNLIAILFIVATLNVFGQIPNNSIQVEISETVELKATEYIYHVSNEKQGSGSLFDLDFDDDYDEDNEFMDEIPEPEPLTINQMQSILEDENFKCSLVANGKYDVKAGQDEEDLEFDRKVIEVRVSNKDELARLSKVVLDMGDAYGELKNVNFEKVENQYQTLFPKMMQSAKKKASLLASSSGNKVGDVTQISEGNGGLSLYGDEMGDYMGQVLKMSSALWKQDIPSTKEVKVTLTYVFELD